MWEGFLSQPPISKYCPFWLCLMVLLNPTSGRDASHMCSSGTHVSWAQTSKSHLGGVSPRCGIEQNCEA